jgi:DNA modification methylase
MHENAFRYFGGLSIEIVYDQDRLLAVSENSGDLIMTAEFTKYQQTRKFRVYLCRKSDPQSKGKIEQVVKYVKNNFAKNRTFDNLIDWQDSCMRWLKRTGNYKVHHNTKKRPFEVYALEKQHLQKVSGTYIFEDIFVSSITRNINKDNVIRFDGNRYSVPLGTYRKGAQNIAYVEIYTYACSKTVKSWQSIKLQKEAEILYRTLPTGNVIRLNVTF